MKRRTLMRHQTIANDLMFYIFTHIDTDINLDEQALRLGVDKVYLHKVFKSIFGRNIYETIKAVRMQKAASLLLTNPLSTISEVAQMCGYASQASFIRAFKARFAMTPSAWRKGGYAEYSRAIIAKEKAKCCLEESYFESLTYRIVRRPAVDAYYIRHLGYDPTIADTWRMLQTWAYTRNILTYQSIALFHDNPAVTPHEQCHYVACIVPEESFEDDGSLPKFTIAGGTYAEFTLEGCRGDLLMFLRWVSHRWLPQQGFETTTKPPYAIMTRNHHLDSQGRFAMTFYLSVRY